MSDETISHVVAQMILQVDRGGPGQTVNVHATWAFIVCRSPKDTIYHGVARTLGWRLTLTMVWLAL